jgi:ribosomal protein S27E
MMVKEFPAEVFLQRVYCNECGCIINEYENATNLADILFLGEKPKPQYKYTCKNCGNVQIESVYPTFIVKGNAPNTIEVDE